MRVGVGEYTECFFYITPDENDGAGVTTLEIPHELFVRYCRARDEWQRVQCLLDNEWQRQNGEGEP